MVRISVVLLVDPQGRVLLMERDEFAPRAPNKWGMVGGHVEEGEDFEPAVYREALEETGLALPPGSLELWHEGTFQYSDADEAFDYRVWAGATTARDEDIVVGEGRQIVFVEPEVVPTLDMAESCAVFLPKFLASETYQRLCRQSKERPMTRPLTVIPVPGTGCEDVVVDGAGDVWTGTEDGGIYRVRADGGLIELVGNTGGRPLGLELYDDRILVCDARLGLLVIDRAGRVEPMLGEVDGVPMKFCNNAAVASNGDIWFTDSSRKFGIDDWKSDFVQHTQTGRLLCRRADGTVEVHVDGLAFANGVALAADESWVAVAETGRRTVVRLWLSGERTGQREFLVEDLPGYPDNIALGSDGLVWVTIASPRDPVVELLQHRAPLGVRKAVTRIPDALQPKPRQTARVQAFDSAGTVVHDVDADASSYHMVTGVREHDGRVWMGSLVEPAIAWASVQ